MTPATWSMVQVFLTDAMATASIPPYVGYGRIGGRIYLNLSVMMTLSAAVGVNQRSYRSLSEDVFGKLPDDLEIPPVNARWRDIIRAVLPMALHVLGEARRDARCWTPIWRRIQRSVIADEPRSQRFPRQWSLPTCGPECSIPSSIE